MASIIMASSKTLIAPPPTPKPKQTSLKIPQFPLIPVSKLLRFPSISAKSLAIASLSAATTPLPAFAAGIRMSPGSRFFDLTLPFIFAGFLYFLLEFRKYLIGPEMKLVMEEVKKEEEERDRVIKEMLRPTMEELRVKEAELRAMVAGEAAGRNMRMKLMAAAWNQMKKEMAAEWNQKVEEWKLMKSEAVAAWNQMKTLAVTDVDALMAERREVEAEITAAKAEMRAVREKLEAQKKRVGEVQKMAVLNAVENSSETDGEGDECS